MECPTWCIKHHYSDVEVVHCGRVEVGNTYALIEAAANHDGLTVGVMSGDDYFTPSDARDLATALLKAADLVEAKEGDR